MSGERPWVDEALSRLTSDEAVALISVLETLGSTPREAGARMVVTLKDAFGTIGGGNLEFKALDQARLCLGHQPGTWRIQDYPLGPLMNQCCGGRVRVMIERLDPEDTNWLRALQNGQGARLVTHLETDRPARHVQPGEFAPAALASRKTPPVAGDSLIEDFETARTPLTLFGAGHVGQALIHVLKGLPFRIGWYDNREDYAGLEGLALLEEPGLIEQAKRATGQVLILTHDHALDYRLLVATLASGASFIGLIGSATKRARFLSRLRSDGFSEADIARVTCPIGLAGLSGKAPEIIAVSVTAQLLMQRQAAVSVTATADRLGCAC